MFNRPFICGSSHLPVDEDEMDVLSPCSTPRRSKRGGRENKNPYANRGLDKFSALLADLEDKKQKIYTQVGAGEISIVRFVFPSTNSDVVKPIVVKLKGKKDNEAASPVKHNNINNNNPREVEEKRERQNTDDQTRETRKKLSKSVSWKVNMMKWEDLKNPRYYLPLAIILILVFLAIYGRTFAILCTSIGWYVIPTIRSGGGSNSSSSSKNKTHKKKEYVRRFSEKNISTPKSDDSSTSPKSVLTGRHAHRKSF